MRRIAVSCAVVAALLLTACGGDDNGSRGDVLSTSFCGSVREYSEMSDSATVDVNVDSSMSEAEVERHIAEAKGELERLTDEGLRLLDELEARAPEEIRLDVSAVVAAERRYLAALESNDFDPFALLGDTAFAPDPPAAEAADRVNEYTERECGTRLKPAVGEVVDGERPATAPSPPPRPPPPPTRPPPPPPPPGR